MNQELLQKLKKIEDEHDKFNEWVKFRLEETNGKKPRHSTIEVIQKAYLEKYHLDSRCDGCTVVSEMDWPGFKHPACVGHDYLYCKGGSKIYADWWFFLANLDFQHEIRGFIRFFFVFTFGWWAWHQHRMRDCS